MSEKEVGPGEAPPPYGHGYPAGEGAPYPPPGQGAQYPPPGQSSYPPPGQGYPGQPAPVYGQPYGQPGYAPQYGGYTTGYNNVVSTQMQIQTPPPDHFCLAVFVTLCCFWPTGILAIMKASDARSSTARGDMVTANNQARSAKQMINVSIGVGIASFVVVGIIVGVYVGLILNTNYWG